MFYEFFHAPLTYPLSVLPNYLTHRELIPGTNLRRISLYNRLA